MPLIGVDPLVASRSSTVPGPMTRISPPAPDPKQMSRALTVAFEMAGGKVSYPTDGDPMPTVKDVPTERSQPDAR